MIDPATKARLHPGISSLGPLQLSPCQHLGMGKHLLRRQYRLEAAVDILQHAFPMAERPAVEESLDFRRQMLLWQGVLLTVDPLLSLHRAAEVRPELGLDRPQAGKATVRATVDAVIGSPAVQDPFLTSDPSLSERCRQRQCLPRENRFGQADVQARAFS